MPVLYLYEYPGQCPMCQQQYYKYYLYIAVASPLHQRLPFPNLQETVLIYIYVHEDQFICTEDA